MNRRHLAPFLFAALSLVGCRSCTRRECDPMTLRAHCEERTLVYCASEGASYGTDFGTRISRNECAPQDTCIDDAAGAAACVHAPATRCTPETFAGDCDGQVPLVCTSPSPSVSEGYVVRGSSCVGDAVCAVTPSGAICVRNGTPCTLPEGRISACQNGQIIACSPGKSGRIETLRTICTCTEKTLPNGTIVASCGSPPRDH